MRINPHTLHNMTLTHPPARPPPTNETRNCPTSIAVNPLEPSLFQIPRHLAFTRQLDEGLSRFFDHRGRRKNAPKCRCLRTAVTHRGRNIFSKQQSKLDPRDHEIECLIPQCLALARRVCKQRDLQFWPHGNEDHGIGWEIASQQELASGLLIDAKIDSPQGP